MRDPVWGGLAELMGGAPQSDGAGSWTLPASRRWRPPPLERPATRHPRRRPTAAQREEGRQFAVAVAREVHRRLLDLEAEQARMRAAAPKKLGKPVGKHLTAITEDLIREAHRLYTVGRDQDGRPLSVRKVAAIILPRTGYKSARSCAECLHKAWQARNLPLRDRVAAVRAAVIVHGELVNTKDWRTDEAKARKNAYKTARRAHRKCAGVKQTYPRKGSPCPLWAMDGSDYCYQHDPSKTADRDAHLERMRASVGAGS